MTGGRPLRFLLLVMSGWIGARAIMLWPGDPIAATAETLNPPTRATALPLQRLRQNRASTADTAWIAAIQQASAALPPSTRAAASGIALQQPGKVSPSSSEQQAGLIAGLPAPLPPATKPRSRLFGSAWAVARGGGSASNGLPGVQLGGSQAGIRLGYALTENRRLAIVGRLSSPLGSGSRDVALGIEWQPTRLPVRLVAEHRLSLNGGRGGPTLAAIGGLGPVALAAGFRLEAYAQAGVIARDGGEGYADGALRVARPLATLGSATIDLGAGAWGAAQKGASRLDVGPSLSATVPLGPQPVRLSLDWRQRLAGNASPGSGLVVTLGTDF